MVEFGRGLEPLKKFFRLVESLSTPGPTLSQTLRTHVWLATTYLVGEDEVGLDAVLPLAGLSVRLSFVEPRVALAEVGALRVDALLRADPGDLVALVHVLASLSVGHQLVA